MPKVLVSDKLSEDVVAIFKSQGISVDYKPGMSAEELAVKFTIMMVWQSALRPKLLKN